MLITFRKRFDALRVNQRRVISIPNRALENQMPLDEPGLWFDPARVPAQD